MKYCLQCAQLWLSFNARKTNASPMTAWGWGRVSALQAQKGLTTVYSPHNTLQHHPAAPSDSDLPPFASQRVSVTSRIPIHFPLKQRWPEALLAKAIFLGPTFSSLIAIPDRISGTVGCRFPKGPEGMPLTKGVGFPPG